MDERAPLLQDDELLASRSSALNGSHGPKPSKGVYQHVTINTPAEVHLESIQWKNIGCMISTTSGFFRQEMKHIEVLKGVTGHAQAGSTLAIMGPSGCGKTSLLDTLCGRKTVGTLRGQILLNQQPLSFQDMAGVCGYVSQDDVLLPTLTVRETLNYTLKLRRPRMVQMTSGKELVEEIISELKLNKVADSKVGNASMRGVSGGERRRVSIAIELVAQKSVLMLDEPTSGLDSSAALLVMRLLRKLARARDVIIICTIHQPRSSIYQNFDNVLLLAAGQVMFHGPVQKVPTWLSDVGFPCPAAYNPADWLLDVVADDGELDEALLADTTSQGRLAQLSRAHREDPNRYLEPLVGQQWTREQTEMYVRQTSARVTSFGFQLRVLVERNFKHMVRHPAILLQQVIQYIGCAVFVGLLFSNVTQSLYEQKTLALSFALDVHGVFSFFAIPTFLQNRLIFNREYQAGSYGALAYYIASFTTHIPSAVVVLLYSYILWVLQKLHGSFWYNYSIHLLVAHVYLGLNETIGASVGVIQLAIGFAGLLNIYTMVFSGVMALYPNIPDYLKFNWFLSPLGPANSALLDNEFDHDFNGTMYLKQVGMPLQGQTWTPVYYLFGFLVLFRTLCFLALKFLQKEKR